MKWIRFGLCTVLLVMLTACELTLLEPAEPTSAAPATEAMAKPAAGIVVVANNTFTSERSQYTITLPDGWQIFSLLEGAPGQFASALEAQAATIEAATAVSSVVSQFIANGGAEGAELIAIGPDVEKGRSDIVLTVTVIERHGLTLAQYLAAIQVGLPADVDIIQSTLGYRGEGAAFSGWLQFNYLSSDGAASTTYGQYAQLASVNDKFVLLSFSAHSEQFYNNQSDIEDILDSIVLF